MTLQQQVICAFWFFGTGIIQRMVLTDEHLSIAQETISRTVGAVTTAIVKCLGARRIDFNAEDRAAIKQGFARADGKLAGVVGCVDATLLEILGPRDTSTVTEAA